MCFELISFNFSLLINSFISVCVVDCVNSIDNWIKEHVLPCVTVTPDCDTNVSDTIQWATSFPIHLTHQISEKLRGKSVYYEVECKNV